MKEISNSTLALMVVAAILVSVFGSFMSLSKLNQLGVTGLVISDSGYANVTVSGTASINLSDRSIDVGTLEPGTHNDSETVDDWFVVENIGAVNFSLQIKGGSQVKNGTGAFTSMTGCAATTPSTCLMIRCVNASGISSGACKVTSYTALNTTYSVDYLIDLHNDALNDTAWFGVNITVPTSEGSGLKSQTVDFLATSSA